MSAAVKHLGDAEKIAESLITGKSFESLCGEAVTSTRKTFLDRSQDFCQECMKAADQIDPPASIPLGLTVESLFELVLKRGYERREQIRNISFPWTLGASSLTAWPES